MRLPGLEARVAFLIFIHRNKHGLVSICGHGDRRLYYDQNTQIITEVDVKLNKWHIAMEKLYRKQLKQNNFLKILPDRYSNHAPKSLQTRALPN